MSPIEGSYVMTITPDDPITKTGEFQAWLKACGIDPNNCYRIEIPITEFKSFSFALDEEGKKFIIKDEEDPNNGEIARADPVTVTDIPYGPPSFQEINEAARLKNVDTMGPNGENEAEHTGRLSNLGGQSI